MPDTTMIAPPGDPDLLARLEPIDLQLLRALHRASTTRSRTHAALARAAGLDFPAGHARLEQLEDRGLVVRWLGLRIPQHISEKLGTALWVCIGCGCVDERACEGGCSWQAPHLCSRCGL